MVAVSGGADSVALLRLLAELRPILRLRLTVAHFHHGIRGRAADGDARFVRQLAGQLAIPFEEGRGSVPRLAARDGVSLEMAAREARYRFLVESARRVQADCVATAHTADDQAETVLLKLARGTGLRGLAGIPPETTMSGVRIVRPLLRVTRAEIERYLRAGKQRWREDETNRNCRHLRNRIRHKVLPFLAAELNPRIREALQRMAALLRDEDDWMHCVARDLASRCIAPDGSLRLPALAGLHPAAQRRVLLHWLVASGLAPADVDSGVVEDLRRFTAGTGKSSCISTSGGRQIRKSGECLQLLASAKARRTIRSRRLKIPGALRLPEVGLEIQTRMAPGLKKQTGAVAGRLPADASLSLRALGGRTLSVRGWQNGDRIRPLGMKGSKKLQDVFTEAGVEAARRHSIPLILAGEEIVWVPGYRVAQGWEVLDPTAPSLQIRVESISTRSV
jgi:tRNA(Ile)-lysidine synthase